MAATPIAARSALNRRVTALIRVRLTEQHRAQSDLAALIGWTPHALSRRMKGAVSWNLDEIEVVAQALGVTPRQLLDAPIPFAVPGRLAG